MTEVESVALWVSIIGAVLSISLALVAMYFSLRVNDRNQKLTEQFANTLTSITEKTTRVEYVVNSHTDRIVDAFIATRVGNESVQLPGTDGHTNSHQEQSQMPDHLSRQLSRLASDVEEIKLRQRLSSSPPVREWLPAPPPLQPGERVRVREDSNAPEVLRGEVGTVVRQTATVTFRQNNEQLTPERHYAVKFPDGMEVTLSQTYLEPASE